MPAWPASLPQVFEARGFRDALPEQLVRSELDGLEKTRRHARRAERYRIDGDMLMTTAQWSALEAFMSTIGDGALAFDFPDPDNSAATVPVAFADPPRLTTIGGALHTVRLSLERQA